MSLGTEETLNVNNFYNRDIYSLEPTKAQEDLKELKGLLDFVEYTINKNPIILWENDAGNITEFKKRQYQSIEEDFQKLIKKTYHQNALAALAKKTLEDIDAMGKGESYVVFYNTELQAQPLNKLQWTIKRLMEYLEGKIDPKSIPVARFNIDELVQQHISRASSPPRIEPANLVQPQGTVQPQPVLRPSRSNSNNSERESNHSELAPPQPGICKSSCCSGNFNNNRHNRGYVRVNTRLNGSNHLSKNFKEKVSDCFFRALERFKIENNEPTVKDIAGKIKIFVGRYLDVDNTDLEFAKHMEIVECLLMQCLREWREEAEKRGTLYKIRNIFSDIPEISISISNISGMDEYVLQPGFLEQEAIRVLEKIRNSEEATRYFNSMFKCLKGSPAKTSFCGVRF